MPPTKPRADSGEEVISKPTKPPRRFPWRLWLYAILMTGAAGAGGYFTWTYRKSSMLAEDTAKSCQDTSAKALGSAVAKEKAACDADKAKLAGDTKASLADADKKQKDLTKQLDDLSKNLNASKEEITALAAQKAETEKRVAALEELTKQFAKMVETGTLNVSARNGSLVISLPSEVLFKSGSAELSKPGENAVREVGFTLKKFPERRFLVLGHTDDQPLVRPKTDPAAATSWPKDNWELSMSRALTVTRLLVESGMDPKNLVPSGAGEHDPLGKDRAKNRRIEIALLPAINELPKLPDSIK